MIQEIDNIMWHTAYFRTMKVSWWKWLLIKNFGKRVTGEDAYGLPCAGYWYRGKLYYHGETY